MALKLKGKLGETGLKGSGTLFVNGKNLGQALTQLEVLGKVKLPIGKNSIKFLDTEDSGHENFLANLGLKLKKYKPIKTPTNPKMNLEGEMVFDQAVFSSKKIQDDFTLKTGDKITLLPTNQKGTYYINGVLMKPVGMLKEFAEKFLQEKNIDKSAITVTKTVEGLEFSSASKEDFNQAVDLVEEFMHEDTPENQPDILTAEDDDEQPWTKEDLESATFISSKPWNKAQYYKAGDIVTIAGSNSASTGVVKTEDAMLYHISQMSKASKKMPLKVPLKEEEMKATLWGKPFSAKNHPFVSYKASTDEFITKEGQVLAVAVLPKGLAAAIMAELTGEKTEIQGVTLEESLAEEFITLHQKLAEFEADKLMVRMETIKKELQSIANEKFGADDEVQFVSNLGVLTYSPRANVKKFNDPATLLSDLVDKFGMEAVEKVVKIGVTQLSKLLSGDEMEKYFTIEKGSRSLVKVSPKHGEGSGTTAGTATGSKIGAAAK